MVRMITLLTNLKHDARGASAMEYGLIAAMIVVAIIGGLTSFADTSIGLWETVETKIVG
jgi:pilus assembly protein Flp/PilA